jgi:hypothetical protein
MDTQQPNMPDTRPLPLGRAADPAILERLRPAERTVAVAAFNASL